MMFEVGKEYKTRAGWKAKVIWKLYSHTEKEYYEPTEEPDDMSLVKSRKDIYHLIVIHKPDIEKESGFGLHDAETGKVVIKEYVRVANDGPVYDQDIKMIIEHPADLIEEWKEEDE